MSVLCFHAILHVILHGLLSGLQCLVYMDLTVNGLEWVLSFDSQTHLMKVLGQTTPSLKCQVQTGCCSWFAWTVVCLKFVFQSHFWSYEQRILGQKRNIYVCVVVFFLCLFVCMFWFANSFFPMAVCQIFSFLFLFALINSCLLLKLICFVICSFTSCGEKSVYHWFWFWICGYFCLSCFVWIKMKNTECNHIF